MRFQPFHGLLVGALLSGSALQAQTVPDPASPAAAVSGKMPSLYVRCDGNPNNMTGGEAALRYISLMAVVGLLAPPPETADANKRLSGQAGIDACTQLIDQPKTAEGNIERRIELIFARAVHRIEIGDYEGAIADARLPATDEPLFTATRAYKIGLGLSAYGIEALARVGQGKYEAAADRALDMAEAAPYDIVNLIRVSHFLALTDRYGLREQAVWQSIVQARAESLMFRAESRRRVGDFAGAAQDVEVLHALLGTMSKDLFPRLGALAALDRAVAGDMDGAASLIAEARKQTETLAAKGDSKGAGETAQMEDFLAIWKLADAGDIKQARLLFAGRGRWTEISPAIVAKMATRLRAGLPVGEMIGSLAKDPATYRTDERDTLVAAINNADDGKSRYGAIRQPVHDSDFNPFISNVWRDKPSKYLLKPNEQWKAQFVTTVRNGSGPASGYALLFDNARTAKKLGKKGFVAMPLRKYLYGHFYRFGDPTSPDTPAALLYDADKVIADLAPLFPQPVKR